jgi:hypothetical protein
MGWLQGFMANGCKRDNMIHTSVLKGLLLGKYFFEYFLKILQNILQFFFNYSYYYIKVYVKDFKIYVIFKKHALQSLMSAFESLLFIRYFSN